MPNTLYKNITFILLAKPIYFKTSKYNPKHYGVNKSILFSFSHFTSWQSGL